jgi:hypothetical protein
MSEPEMLTLLQRLVARHLDEDEVVDSSLRQNWPGYASHFNHRRSTDGNYGVTLEVGHDRYYIAAYEVSSAA